MTSRSLGHRAPLLWLLLPYIAGISAGRLTDAAPAATWLLAGALAAAIAAVLLRRRTAAWAAALGAAMLLAGVSNYARHARRLAFWDSLPPREARLWLRIDRVFAQDTEGKTSGLAVVAQADAPVEELTGQRVYFSLALPPGNKAPVRSARLTARGVVERVPRRPPPDTFDDYLAMNAVGFKFTRGRVLTEERRAFAYYRLCAAAQKKFSAILSAGLADKRPELAGALRAMMLSQKHELSRDQEELFMHSGTMHLFAISGLHIGVIAAGLQAVLVLLRLPRGIRFAAGLATLWLFVDITGASPSAVRAFVMVAFLQAAFLFRRPGNALAALVMSAFVVLLAAPLQLFTASFQMSYGIVAALLLLGLPLGEIWQAKWRLFASLPEVSWTWWQRALDFLQREALVALGLGVATALVAAVTGIAFFHLFTPGAIAANLALIPLASLAILAGFVSLLGGLCGWMAASVLCNHAAGVVLAVIQWLIGRCTRVPGAFFPAAFAAPWWSGAALAAVLAACLAGYALRWRHGSVWAPFAVLALVMILGVNFG
ncbi:MAG TPA: ComEC/Rec2 family competence protein [Opitutaceae bacterium]|nr:ComEC/Rec2 family competence protein [Opitutaceae bacterium]